MTRQRNVVETSRRVSAAGIADKRLPMGEPGTILFAMYASVGETALLGTRATWNQAILGITPATGSDGRFLKYWLDGLRPRLAELFRSTTQDNINAEQVGRLPFPRMPAGEQARVADYLDRETSRIDALIAAAQQRIDLQVERQGSLVQALVLGRPADRARCNDPLGPLYPVPAGWKFLRNKTFLREVVDLSETGVEELLTVSHITGVTSRSEKDVTMFLAESNEGYKRVQPGDLVINTMWAWMGALGVSRLSGIVSPGYAVYRFTRKDLDVAYFDSLFRSRAYVAEITRFSKGVWTSRLRLYPEAFLGLRSPFPPEDEQLRIAGLIAELRQESERLSDLFERSVQLLVERRQALITAAVTGDLGIPGVAVA